MLLWAAMLLLVQETTAVAVFGWGLVLAMFTPRRKWGVLLCVASAGYLALCVKVFIPHFGVAGRFERLDLFGTLGKTSLDLMSAPFTQPAEFFGRLCRRESFYFVLLMLITMAALPLRGWRVALAAIPTLVGILLMENSEWLSIKFWHQSAVLPFLFFGGVASLSGKDSLEGPVRKHRTHRGLALAAFVSAAMGHYFYGFSPLSKPYEVYANDPRMHAPDPRLATVERLRAEIPTSATIHATERLAAHFTDYDKLYTGIASRAADFLIVDRSDDWDRSGLAQQVIPFASENGYELHAEHTSIVVFRRQVGSDANNP